MKREMSKVGVTIIGDEILSGRRSDKHFAHAISYFQELDVEIAWVTYIGDDGEALIDHFRMVRARGDIVFSFGGIGATPDDRTRLSMAMAHDVPLTRHPQAVELIERRFGEGAYPYRILMAELPTGSRLIPNDFNQIPGFSLGSIYCLPGFPEMAWQMMDWVVQTQLVVPDNRDLAFSSIIVHNVRESELIPLLESIQQQFPDTKVSSLPHFPGEGRWQTELGVRGSNIQVMEVMDLLQTDLGKRGYRFASMQD